MSPPGQSTYTTSIDRADWNPKTLRKSASRRLAGEDRLFWILLSRLIRPKTYAMEPQPTHRYPTRALNLHRGTIGATQPAWITVVDPPSPTLASNLRLHFGLATKQPSILGPSKLQAVGIEPCSAAVFATADHLSLSTPSKLHHHSLISPSPRHERDCTG